jgi:hypothetical protein
MSGLKISSRYRGRVFVVLLAVWCALAFYSSLGVSQIVSSGRALPCQTSQLLAKEDRKESDGIDGGGGHHAMTIAINNRSSSSCVLRGVPTLELSYTATRLPFATQVCSNCGDYLFHRRSVTGILLEPNRSAYVVLGYDTNDGNGNCTEADPKFGTRFQYSAMTLSLYLPDQYQSPLKIRLDAWRSCGVIDITPFLLVPIPKV